MSTVNPYMHEVKLHLPSIQKKVARSIFDFIGRWDIGKSLDIGSRNPLTKVLENHYFVKIDSTNVDLDVDKLSGRYRTVFCFEVIEHLFNPLHFLLEAFRILEDDGRLFLSTPRGRPHFLWFKHHFHEYHKRELLHLIDRSGFKLVRLKYYRVFPIWRGFLGFRPFLRLLLQRKCLIELKK